MTLIACSECGAEISGKAASCPKCGNPIEAAPEVQPETASSGLGCGGISLLILGAIIILAIVSYATSPAPPAPSARHAVQAFDKSAPMQARREKLIADLRDQGVFTKVSCRPSGADAWTGPAFDSLEFDDRSSFMNVVYVWCYDAQRSGQFVRLKDGRTGKELGLYTAEGGLKMD